MNQFMETPPETTPSSSLIDAFFPEGYEQELSEEAEAEKLLGEGVLSGLGVEERTRLLKQAVLRRQLLRLAMKGVDATQAARIVGCSKWTTREIYREPRFRQEVMGKVEGAFADIDHIFREKKKSLHERIDEQAERSFEGLVSLLDDTDTSNHLKAKIHMDFLDRSAESQKQTVVNHARLDPQQLIAAARTAVEMDNVVPFRKKVG